MKYINFSQLRSFHAVAQTESITLASKLLNISQPTITKQIQLLENFLKLKTSKLYMVMVSSKKKYLIFLFQIYRIRKVKKQFNGC